MIHSKVDSTWSGVLAFRGNGAVTDWSQYGDRAPAIFYNKEGNLHFNSAVSGKKHAFKYPVELNKLYHIEIAQEETDGKVFYTVKIDGETVRSDENTDGRAIEDVKVFAGDKWNPPADGSLTNLIWESFPRSEACPADWSQFGGRCYKFVKETKVWSEARDDCLSQQADLASIHSSEENQFVNELGDGRRFWLGGKFGWSWSDGTPWDYQNWEPGQPSGGEDCLNMEQTRKWNDRSCNNIGSTIGYVCKK